MTGGAHLGAVDYLRVMQNRRVRERSPRCMVAGQSGCAVRGDPPSTADGHWLGGQLGGQIRACALLWTELVSDPLSATSTSDGCWQSHSPHRRPDARYAPAYGAGYPSHPMGRGRPLVARRRVRSRLSSALDDQRVRANRDDR
jgi:hypothetical protein